MMYSGIDLHSNNSVVSVVDDSDRVVAQKRLPNDIAKIVGFLTRWQGELAGVVVESTYNWYWLVATACTSPTLRQSSNTKD
jgi:transposase